ncbi:MAG TPA: glutamate-cysteine ligase family protein [Candidatus Micrarchaeota archaeon]|nr:glutamate-cysteine ligase family protein [Candidatus Micrarchaeota archaeon]
MIGYEFELFLQDSQSKRPINADQYRLFHGKLAQDGWANSVDPVTHGITGSKKNGIAIKTDDPIYIMELNMPPKNTIQEAHAQMSDLLAYLKGILNPLGIDMLGIGVFPCPVPDTHEYTTFDSWGRHIIPFRYFLNRLTMHDLASNQFWYEIPRGRFVEYLNAANQLNGICISLLGNSSIQDGKPSGCIEKRPILWQEFSKTPWPVHMKVIGMPMPAYTSVHDYISRWLSTPVYYAFHDGMPYFVEDLKMTGEDVMNSESLEIIKVDTSRQVIKPTLKELWYFQKNVFFEARGRITFKPGAKIQDFKSAYDAKDDKKLLECIDGTFVECRFISSQNSREFSIGAALLLGLLENFEETQALLAKHDYKYWRDLRGQAIESGLDFEADGKHITSIVGEFMEIAKKGLERRGFGEEKFLEPAKPLLARKENPGQRKLRLLKEGGIEKVLEDCRI